MIKHENLKRFRETQQWIESDGFIPILTYDDGGILFLRKEPKVGFKYLHNDATVDNWGTNWEEVFMTLFEAKPAIMDLLLDGADND